MSLTRTLARVVKGGALTAAVPPGGTPAASTATDPLALFREQAETVLAQAQVQAEELRTAAHAEGFARGLAEAREWIAREVETRAAELAAGQCAEVEARVQTLLDELGRQHQMARDQWLARWERGAVQLAGDLAARLLGRELAVDPGARAEVIRQALELAAGNAAVRVWVHPDDVLAVTGDCRGAGWQLLADNQLARGDCRLEFACGEIDARVQTQVRRLLEELLPSDEGEPPASPTDRLWGGAA